MSLTVNWLPAIVTESAPTIERSVLARASGPLVVRLENSVIACSATSTTSTAATARAIR